MEMAERSLRPEPLPRVVLESSERTAMALSRKGFRGGVGRKRPGAGLVDVEIQPVLRPIVKSLRRPGLSGLNQSLQRAKTSLSVLTFPGFAHSYELQKVIGEQAFESLSEQTCYTVKGPDPLPCLSPVLSKPLSVQEPAFTLKPALMPSLSLKFHPQKRFKHGYSRSVAQKPANYFRLRGLSNI